MNADWTLYHTVHIYRVSLQYALFDECEVLPKDTVLLCTDGLTNMIETRDIYDLIVENKENVKEASKKLVNEANKRGGHDNISVVLISNY